MPHTREVAGSTALSLRSVIQRDSDSFRLEGEARAGSTHLAAIQVKCKKALVESLVGAPGRSLAGASVGGDGGGNVESSGRQRRLAARWTRSWITGGGWSYIHDPDQCLANVAIEKQLLEYRGVSPGYSDLLGLTGLADVAGRWGDTNSIMD